MTRRIPAVLLVMVLGSAAATAQTRDWPDREGAGPTTPGEPGASIAPGSEGTPGGTTEAAPTGTATTGPVAGNGGLSLPTPGVVPFCPGGPGCNDDTPLPPGRIWGGAEFLFWFTGTAHLPILATSAPLGGTGILGDTGTTNAVGGTRYGGGFHPGGRFYIGAWFDERRTFGIQADAFVLAGSSASYSASSTGGTVLARPFFNTTTLAQDAVVLGDANSTGSLAASAQVGALVGVNVLLREYLCCLSCSWMRVDGLGGFRFLRLVDHVNIGDNSMITGAGNTLGLPVGTTLSSQDSFDSSTNFYGLDIGLTGETLGERLFLNWVTKFAVGTNHQVVEVNGNTTTTQPGSAPQTFGQGFLAGPSNIGSYGRQVISFSPQIDLRLGYRITPSALVWIGYTFILWTGVARAPDQINQIQNPTLLPPTGLGATSTQNTFHFEGNDFWIQGVSAGFFYRF